MEKRIMNSFLCCRKVKKWFLMMKITMLLLIAGFMQVSGTVYSQATKFNFRAENKQIVDILREIEDKSDFRFFYIREQVDVERRVTLRTSDATVEQILDEMFNNQGVGYKVLNDNLILLSPKNNLDQLEIAAVQQQRTLTGTVSDETGQPLPGVSVVVQGTSSGTITDNNGNYSLSNVPPNASLVFSFVGMRTQVIPVGNSAKIDVTLSEDAIGIDEVVVTALNIRREERELGYAMTQISGQELALTSQVNPVNSLQGKTAGVQISQTAGGTFGGSRITIRGNSTFDLNTQPIFVIDGVVMDNEISGVNSPDWGNQLKNLNPDDYESFSILKGAAATALYGSRAIHGVVMITTKSGQKQQGLGVEFNQTLGIRYVYDTPDFQNEYGSGNTAGWFSFVDNGPNTRIRDDKHDVSQFFAYDLTTGLPSVAFNSWEEHAASWGPRFDGQEIIDYDGSKARWLPQPNNYKDFFDRGVLRNTNVSVNGGGETNSFRLSFSTLKETGVNIRNDFGKNSISIKGSQDLIKAVLKVGAVVHYTRSLSENPSTGNSGWFHDGFPRNYDVNKWRKNYKDIDGGVPYPAGDAYNYTRMSRIWMGFLEDENLRTEGSLVSKANIDFKIAKGLSGTVEGYMNQFTWTGEYKTTAKDVNRLSGAYGMGNGEKFQHSFSGKLFYDKQISENFRFDAVVGAEVWNSKTVYTSASTSGGFKVRDFFAISNSKNAPNAEGGVTFSKQIQSAYGYFNLAYKRDLYLNTTFRHDWSSALVYPDGSGNPGFLYPSASLSWVLSETLSLPEFFTFAKLRASYAIVGNDTTPYLLSTGFSPDNFNANPNLTMFRFRDATAVSPGLVAEKKHSFETGIDLRMLDGRASLDVAYYKDNNRNQIISLPVPQESGIGSTLINAGNLQNSGVEIAASVAIIDNKNFSWDIGGNWTHNRDKIIELAPGINEFNLYGNPSDANSGTASYAYVGGNYGDLVTRKGYKPYDGTNKENHGIPILWDRNGWSVAYMPGIANMDSLHVMGNMQPDWYAGLNSSIRYKRLRFNVILDARIGGEIYSSDARYGMHQGVLEMSLPNRDESKGGIVWVSKGQGQNFYGRTYSDGYIPNGVFPDGTKVTFGPANNRQSVDVGGLTYQQAYERGLVEPTHWSGFVYRHTSASTGTPITGVSEQSWIAIRELSLSYTLPRAVLTNMFIKDASFSVTGRDFGYLYNSMPDNINPVIENNVSANPLQMGNQPYIRSVTFAVNLKF